MQNQENTRRIPIAIIAGLSAVVVAAGSGTAWWTWNAIHSDTANNPEAVTPTAPDAVQPTEPQPVAPAVETTARAYWIDVAGNQFELVPAPIQVAQGEQPDEILTTAFETLLEGPSASAAFSEIPEGTELRDLTVESDGVHVDLTDTFTTGGGTASMTGRLAQVVYTASSLDPDAQIWISVDGEPLDVLGGEGLILDQPITREEFDENFPL